MDVSSDIRRAANLLDSTHPCWWRNFNLSKLHKEIRPFLVLPDSIALLEEMEQAWKLEVENRKKKDL